MGKKLILYSAVSLDNCIAGPNGEIDWLHQPEFEIPGEDYGYSNFYKDIGITLMGNKTYEVMMGFDVPFPYPDTTNYVFTRSLDQENTEHVDFISGDIVQFVKALKAAEGRDIWLIGGGEINAILAKHKLIDEMKLTIIPEVLGKGIPLFKGHSGNFSCELLKSKTYQSGLVQLSYSMTNPALK